MSSLAVILMSHVEYDVIRTLNIVQQRRYTESTKSFNRLIGWCYVTAGLPVVLYFRVKFYVPDPAMLREEFTRYLFLIFVYSPEHKI